MKKKEEKRRRSSPSSPSSPEFSWVLLLEEEQELLCLFLLLLRLMGTEWHKVTFLSHTNTKYRQVQMRECSPFRRAACSPPGQGEARAASSPSNQPHYVKDLWIRSSNRQTKGSRLPLNHLHKHYPPGPPCEESQLSPCCIQAHIEGYLVCDGRCPCRAGTIGLHWTWRLRL